MSNPGDSPFGRSQLLRRSPPPTPALPTPAPSMTAPTEYNQPRDPAPQAAMENEIPPEVVSTPEIQKFLGSIETILNEVCSIVADGKMNTDQKLRVTNLCRKVSNGTSQLAVLYQSLKQKSIQAHCTIQHLHDQQNIAKSICNLKEAMETKMSQTESAGNSYANMVKKGADKFIRPANFSSVAIYPNDKLKSSEETKSLVQKIIHPEQMKLHVRGLHKTKNGGVIISTDRKDDIDKLKKSEQIVNSGLIIDEPPKRKPRVVVMGVPSSMQEKEVFTCLYHQNLADKLQDFSLETYLNTVKLSHKSGRKDADTCNYVIEVSAVIRKALISNSRVFVNWSSCPVRDFTLVTRCYKCQQYGHAAKSCRESSYTCGHCGDQGHSVKECTKKTEEPRCATCLHFKKPNKHSTGAADCPAKIMAERRYINSIDYEGA